MSSLSIAGDSLNNQGFPFTSHQCDEIFGVDGLVRSLIWTFDAREGSMTDPPVLAQVSDSTVVMMHRKKREARIH